MRWALNALGVTNLRNRAIYGSKQLNIKKTKYVFIVGLPRTGSKMMQDVLERAQSANCKICMETWFLGDLFRSGVREVIKKHGDMSNDSNVSNFVEYMYSDDFSRPYWRMLRRGEMGIERDRLLRELLKTDRSDRAIYDVLLRTPMLAAFGNEDSRETIIGDKTPGHLYHITTLMKWFPEAKIIHTFRDPRAILASNWRRLLSQRNNGVIHRLTNPLYTFIIVLYTTVTWMYATKLHYKYQSLYPSNYMLSRYEDLVLDPKAKVKRLCDFLEIEPSDDMLMPRKIHSSFSDRVEAGFDEDSLDRWHTHLRPWMKAWLLFWGSRRLKDFGYLSR